MGETEAQAVAETADAGAAGTGQKADSGAGGGIEQCGGVDVGGAGEPEEEAAGRHGPGGAVADVLVQGGVHGGDPLAVGEAQLVQIVLLAAPFQRNPHQIGCEMVESAAAVDEPAGGKGMRSLR